MREKNVIGNNKKITVSVVVSIYRIEAYLLTCIDSILSQTYKNIEVILVDDGSDDACPQICDDYAMKDSRVHVIHKPNGGSTSARKAGICQATGDYILDIDGDDWIEPDYVEKMLESLVVEKVDVVGDISVYMNYSDGRQLERTTPMKTGIYKGKDIVAEVYPNYICEDRFYDTPLSTNVYLYLFRREFLQKIQPQVEDEIAMGEDMALTFRSFLHAKSVAVIDYPGYHYRQQPNSMLHKRDSDHFQRINVLYKNLRSAVRDSDDSERAEAMARKIPRCIFFTLWACAPVRFAELSDTCLFPFSQVKTGSRVFVYGMGVVGRGIMEAIAETGKFELAGCSDQGWSAHAKGITVAGNKVCSVYAPEKIMKCDFDYVVIGVSRYVFRQQITEKLLSLGVPMDKIASIDQSLLIEDNLPF